MNGTVQRWLGGTLLTLGLALASSSVGCVAPVDSEADIDDETEELDSIAQELEGLTPPPPATGGKSGGTPAPGDEVANNGEGSEPQPVPWLPVAIQPETGPGPVDPFSIVHGATPSGQSSE